MGKIVCLGVNCIYERWFIVGYMQNCLLAAKFIINNSVFQPICGKHGTLFTHGKRSFFAMAILLSSGSRNISVIHVIL